VTADPRIECFFAPTAPHGSTRLARFANAYRIGGVTVEPNVLSDCTGPAVRTHDHYDHAWWQGEWASPGLLEGWEVLATPGHSPDHVCFLRAGVLVAGDVVEGPGGTWPLVFNVAAMLRTLERLVELDIRRVLPGHGGETGREQLGAHRERLLFKLDGVEKAVRGSRFGEVEDIAVRCGIHTELVRPYLDALVAYGRVRRDPERARWVG
jgi:glyoxylase-like metal-dependent hydrolase (beta-lactamase superfamily II)